jgi:hypothetical protein
MAQQFFKNIILLALIAICSPIWAQDIHPNFAAIHAKSYGKWPKTISFTQKTVNYRADTVFRTQIWHEAGIFPSLFRIDLGDLKDGNAMIYRGDSTYHFRKSKIVRADIEPNILIYLLGGMFFETVDQVAQKLKKDGFDISKSFKTKWNGKDALVFGTDKDDPTKNQLWYDAKKHYLVRMIQQTERSRLECQFENHQQTGRIWHEGKVKIFANNKLVQTEEYSDFKIDVLLKAEFFEPSRFGSWHWLN